MKPTYPQPGHAGRTSSSAGNLCPLRRVRALQAEDIRVTAATFAARQPQAGELTGTDSGGLYPGRRVGGAVADTATRFAVVVPDDPLPEGHLLVPDGPGDMADRATGLVRERRFGARAAEDQRSVSGPAGEGRRADRVTRPPFEPRQRAGGR